MDAQARFAALADDFTDRPGVRPPTSRRGFGSTALTAGGSIFAMLAGDRLVVKLPAGRVAALIASGAGVPFDAGKGRPMKEWLTVVDGAAGARLPRTRCSSYRRGLVDDRRGQGSS